MKRQRGSVLAGVLGLAIVMTLAATGYLLLTANSSKDDDFALEEARLRNAAESGINLGVRWIRAHYHGYFSSDPLAPNLPITTGTDRYAPMEGFLVRVRLIRNPGFRTLEALATRGAGQDTSRITCKVDSVKASSTAGFLSDVYLSTWQESFLPAN